MEPSDRLIKRKRDLQNLMNRNDVKFFQKNKGTERGYRTKNYFYDKTEKLITNSEGVIQRWVEYFTELLKSTSNNSSPNLPIVYSSTNGEAAIEISESRTYPEVKVDIRKLKNRKTTELGGILPELNGVEIC